MAGRVYVRDLETLLNLQAELGKFNYGASKVLADVARGITDAKSFLNSRVNYWNAELRRREGALRACLAAGDRSCRAEADAVQQAQQALEKLRKLSAVLEQSAGEYQPHANRLQKVLNSTIGKAIGDLQRSIQKYRQYLDPAKPGTQTSFPGLKQHNLEKQELFREESYGNALQGDIGEGIAERVCAEKLGLTPDPRFDKSQGGHGIDTVYLDEKGRLVVVDAKFDKRGIQALEGDQMQQEWIERNADLMRTPGNERNYPGNALIGRDILDRGASGIRRLVVCLDPSTLKVHIYEGQRDGSWICTSSWDVSDLEQPNIE